MKHQLLRSRVSLKIVFASCVHGILRSRVLPAGFVYVTSGRISTNSIFGGEPKSDRRRPNPLKPETKRTDSIREGVLVVLWNVQQGDLNVVFSPTITWCSYPLIIVSSRRC